MADHISRLRDLREDNDLTQQQVAAYLHTSQTMYARYERRASELPLRHLVALCELYNVSADELLGIAADKRRKKGVAILSIEKNAQK
jgi:transcriptional regulator with XRE-family HTH domain